MNKGFTLLEVLLSVAIIAMIGTFSAPLYVNLLVRNDLDIATTTTAQSMRRAQELARASDGDSRWGLRLQSGQIVIFKGTSYAARAATFDEIYSVSPSIGFSGLTEIVFDKVTGYPLTNGTVNLSNQSNNRTVTINSKGMVTY